MADETMIDEQILEGVEHKSFVATSDRTAASLSASGVAAEDVARAAAQAAYGRTWQRSSCAPHLQESARRSWSRRPWNTSF